MRKIYHKNTNRNIFLVLAALILSMQGRGQTTQTFTYTGVIQQFTVPACVSSITITAIGAAGAGGNGTVGGKGASMRGTFATTPGQVLKILVGGVGTLANIYSCGGGGGSFVSDNINTPWIVAGGGGGTNGTPLNGTQDAPVTTAGLSGYSPSNLGLNGIGGTGGSGATGATGCAGNGGGFLTNGVMSTCCSSPGASAFVNGGAGSAGGCSQASPGGFGGGGGGGNWGCGGGGGYSGGGCNYHYPGNAGGGGSYNNGTNQVNVAGFSAGNGTIIISYFPGLPMSTTISPAIGICNGGTATLSATAGMSTYTWSSGANTQTTTVSPVSTTNYTIEGLNPQGCLTKAVVTVTVDQAVPNLTVVNTASLFAGACPGKTVNLLATGATNYTWTGGSPTVTNGVTFTPLAPQDYTVTGENGCGTSTAVASVSVYPLPSVSAVASTPSLCSGSTATLSSAGNATAYAWVSSPTVPFTDGVGFTPTVTASYTVTGTSAFGCTANAVAGITVVTTPTVPLTINTVSICLGKTATITSTGASNHTWTPGAFGNVTTINVSPALGATTYTLVRANSTCSNTQVFTITVNPLPSVSGVASTSSLCSGTSLTLTGVGTATGYTWSGGTIPITNGVGFLPVLTNTYNVVGASINGCTNTAAVPVTVVTTPTFVPTASPQLICIGNSSTLTATGAVNYTWTSSSQTVFTNTFTVTPASSGISTYTVTKANGVCVDTKQISVITNSLPSVFALASPPLACALQSVNISIAGNANTFTWTAPGTPTYNFYGANTIIYPQVSSVYTVAASDGTCITVTTLSITVDPNPTITANATTPSVCVGQSVTLTAFGANNYTWTSPSQTVVGQSITEAPLVATAFTVTGDNSFNCTASLNKVILVFPNPTITVNVPKPIVCSGSVSVLTATGAVSYTWDPTLGSPVGQTVAVTPTATASGPVIYTVTGAYATGCSSQKTVAVGVFVPSLSITGNTNTCYGGKISLQANGGNLPSYVWNTGTSNVPGQNFSITITAPAIYTLSATGTTNTPQTGNVVCPVTTTVGVDVFFNPTVTAVSQRSLICKGEFVEIHADGATSYTWQGQGSANGATLTVSPTNPNSNYSVIGMDNNGCVGTGTVLVKVSGCNGINELTNTNGIMIYPNPNNGEFAIQVDAKINLTLVNELGQVIKKFAFSEANNYTVRVNDLANGIYFLTGKNESGQINQKIVVTK